MELWNSIEPHIIEIASVVLVSVVAYVARMIRQWTGAELDAKAREALHSALLTGVKAAIAAGKAPDDARAQAAIYAATMGAPEAVARFGLSQAQLADMASAKVPE